MQRISFGRIRIYFPIIVSIFLIAIFANIIFATTFTSTVVPNITDAGIYQIFNFSVSNTGMSSIIQVNISIPSEFVLVENSDSTTAPDTNFSNTTNTVTWKNNTVAGFINTSITHYFSINLSVPNVAFAAYNFTVTTLDTNASEPSVSTNVTVVVNDTPPRYSNNITNNTASGLPTLFSLYWTDSVGLSGYIFSTNNTGSWINDSFVSMSGLTNSSNITKTINDTTGMRIGWRVYANDTLGNVNASEIFTFITTDSRPPTYSSLHNSSTNNTQVNLEISLSLGALWSDNTNLSYYMNASSLNGASFINGTWVAFGSGNWSNFTFLYPSSAGGGNYSMKIYAKDVLGNENVTGIWIWHNTTPPGAVFVPGGGTPPEPPVYTVERKTGNITLTITSIGAGKNQAVAILRTDDMSFRRVIVYAKNSLSNIKIMVMKLDDSPASVTKTVSGDVYNYLEIKTENFVDTDINNATVEFAVPKAWLEDNNIDTLNVTLFRWHNNFWNNLNTTHIYDTITESFYSAVLPGFSFFAIGTVGIEPTTPPEACLEDWYCGQWSGCIDGKDTRACVDRNNCGTDINKPETEKDCALEQLLIGAQEFGLGGILLASGIIVIIVVVILLVLKLRGKKIDLSFLRERKPSLDFLKKRKKFKYKYKPKSKEK